VPLALGVVWLVLLLASFAVLSFRRGALLRGTACVFAALIVAGAVAWLAVTAMGALRAGTYWRARPELTFLGVYATALFGEIALLWTIGAKLETKQLRSACWFAFALLGAVLSLVASGGIIYFLIPPSIVLLGLLLSRWYPPAEPIAGLVAVLLLYLTWGELLAALEQLFSPGPLWVVAPAAAIMIASVLIEANGVFRHADPRILVPGAAAIALVIWLVAGTAPAYSEDHQQRFTIEHVTEFPSRQSSWSVLNDGASLPAAYSGLGTWHRGKLNFSPRERWLASAPATAGVRPAAIHLVDAVTNGTERTVRIRLEANGAERMVLIAPAAAHIRAAGVPGFMRAIGDESSTAKFTIACTGRSCDGAVLTIMLRGDDSVTFTVVGARNGLPGSAAPLVRARPRFARPQYTPDETVTITQVTV
jgi:hypothetical protein